MNELETFGTIFPIVLWLVILGGIGFGIYRLLRTKQK
jgi:hypothetical protein